MELPFNDGLQLSNDDRAHLLTLNRLRKLDLQKSCMELALHRAGLAAPPAVITHLEHYANQWSTRSLQHLVELPSAFVVEHGHALALTMFKEWRDEDLLESEDGSM